MRYCAVCGGSFQATRTCPKDRVPVTAAGADPLVGRVLGDRYRILERVGAGGMGQVYRAAHTRIACTFAVKVVWGDIAYDPTIQARFVREAEVASCLSSRFIVRVVDFAADQGGLPYLVMEYLDGPTLHDELARERTFPAARAVRIAQRIASGLAHAHDRGVVHRDLKPENVLLVREDDEEDVVKLLDFGVARPQAAERLTTGGMVLGTPLYMSPEQVRGDPLDGRSDLYALGILLVEMLTGRSPFEAPTLEGILRNQIVLPVPSVRAELEAAGAPAALDAIVQRLLAKRAEDRFASARELSQALTAAVAPPPRASYVPEVRRSPVPRPVAAAIEAAIRAGAPIYNAGDHAGCHGLYRAEAERITQVGGGPAAVIARLRAAIGRAATRTNPTDAAWDLRHAFDDLLFAVPLPVKDGDPIGEELAAFASVRARGETEGQLDILGDFHVAFALELALRLDARGEGEAARRLREAASAAQRTAGGVAAMVAIEPALRALERERTRGPVSTGGPSSSLPLTGPLSSPAAPSSSPLASLASLPAPLLAPPLAPPLGPPPSAPRASAPPSTGPATSAKTGFAPTRLGSDLRDRILRAIRIGAPAFNEGRHDVCARVYAEAATEIAALASADPAAVAVERHLERALEEARRRSPTDAAWVLRYAFDGLLALD